MEASPLSNDRIAWVAVVAAILAVVATPSLHYTAIIVLLATVVGVLVVRRVSGK